MPASSPGRRRVGDGIHGLGEKLDGKQAAEEEKEGQQEEQEVRGQQEDTVGALATSYEAFPERSQ